MESGAESGEAVAELGEKASQFVVDWARLRSLLPDVYQGSDYFLDDGKVGKDEESVGLRNNGCQLLQIKGSYSGLSLQGVNLAF